MFRFMRPEDIPVQYGGLNRPSDLQNGPPKPASEFTIKGREKVNIQIEGIEVMIHPHYLCIFPSTYFKETIMTFAFLKNYTVFYK